MRTPLEERNPHESALIKPGIGQHIFLMFAGRKRPLEDANLTAKPHGLQQLVPVILLVCAACMIGIVLWRQMSAMH